MTAISLTHKITHLSFCPATIEEQYDDNCIGQLSRVGGAYADFYWET